MHRREQGFLVRQILAFSRKDREEKVPVYIKPIIDEVLHLLRASLPSSINISSYIERDTVPVLADSTKIHEIIMNLCTNAVHAMEGEKGNLEIKCLEKDVKEKIPGIISSILPGKYTVITIKDDGCGMTEEIINHAFEPFYTTKPVGKGTGMGLSVVFGIVQSHNGNITLETKPGGGTKFQIYLPKTKGKAKNQHVRRFQSPRGSEKILFVDDEKTLGEMAKDMLGGLGYKVTVFDDSLQALEKFQENPEIFDLVITDQTMPDMTGIELSRKILKIRKDIPIILCTGYSKQVDEEKALELGIKKFLLKPFDKRTLSRAIRSTLDKSFLERNKNLLL